MAASTRLGCLLQGERKSIALRVRRCTGTSADWFQQDARAYLEVCDLFGQSAAQHHDGLVKRFIEAPGACLSEQGLQGITASGPPLPVLLRSLEVLHDMRLEADRRDISTRHDDLARLRGAVAAITD